MVDGGTTAKILQRLNVLEIQDGGDRPESLENN